MGKRQSLHGANTVAYEGPHFVLADAEVQTFSLKRDTHKKVTGAIDIQELQLFHYDPLSTTLEAMLCLSLICISLPLSFSLSADSQEI